MRADAGDNLLALQVFGSYARGEAHEESDVDVCVVLRTVTWDDRRTILDHAADIFLELEVEISPTILSEEQVATWRRQDRPLVRDIDREGIPL